MLHWGNEHLTFDLLARWQAWFQPLVLSLQTSGLWAADGYDTNTAIRRVDLEAGTVETIIAAALVGPGLQAPPPIPPPPLRGDHHQLSYFSSYFICPLILHGM